nr:glycosyltransferase N-terminal domain-containing protein [Oceaniglobus indicus]
MGRSDVDRPDGPLLWLHLAPDGRASAAADLVARLEIPCSLLLTRSDPTVDALFPDDTLCQNLPVDDDRAVDAFLDHWRPDACVWLGGTWSPVLLSATRERNCFTLALDAIPAQPELRRPRWRTGAKRADLAAFDHILTRTQADVARLVAHGADPDIIETPGLLEAAPPPLPCNDADWNALSAALAARPVWLAVDVPADEIDVVLAAHERASRLAHRLLLILVPEDPATGAGLLARIEAAGGHATLRSRDDEPSFECQVFIADTADEAGLWYRLAPIAFMGNTLSGQGAGRNPFEAARLGAVVVHGPATNGFTGIYGALGRARGCVAVRQPGDLGGEIERLLAPDRAAEIAHNAWGVATDGAEATDRALALIEDALGDAGGPR